MKYNPIRLGAVCLMLVTLSLHAATLYVDLNSSDPMSPYSDWNTAATNIQDAVNAANAGDLVLVTNGIYETGSTSFSGSNRVAILKPLTLQSVNGPAVTVIRGYQIPGIVNGSSSIRCVFLWSDAVISGFTLTNGSTTYGGGGVYCSASNSIVSNCVIVGNASSSAGGGALNGSFINCVLAANSATSGGGADYPRRMVNCTVVNNHAKYGCGIYAGSGSMSGVFQNCIFYYNYPPGQTYYTYGMNINNFGESSVSNCCAPELSLPSCLTGQPGIADALQGDYHLQIGSPCIDAGNNSFASGDLDLDGKSRIFNGTVDIGALENHFSGTAHFVSQACKDPTSPFTNWMTAATNIQDAIAIASQDELVIVSNGIYHTGGMIVHGTTTNRVVINKAVTVESLNGPEATLLAGNNQYGPSAVRCVYLTDNATLKGFTLTNGGTSESGGGAWCESTNAFLVNCIIKGNGTPHEGGGIFSGTLSNCLVADNRASSGGGTARSTLINCIVSNNLAFSYGGGALGGFLRDSIVSANQATFGGGVCSNILFNTLLENNNATRNGGGALACSMTTCTIIDNHANLGGGTFNCSLTNCTVTTNTAFNGGGVYSNILVNCHLANNVATNNGGGAYFGTLVSCTISNNSAANYGGGTFSTYQSNCSLIQNAANYGGGSAWGTNIECRFTNNLAVFYGGGVYSNVALNCIICSNLNGGSFGSVLKRCWIIWNTRIGSDSDVLNNCILKYNLSSGAQGSTLNNCTVVNNGISANNYGVINCFATNSIIYGNWFGQNWLYAINHGALSYCCTTPLAPGTGNFTNAPEFLDASHLQTNSPCIDAGNNDFSGNYVDIDGRPRIVNGTVDIGATEFQGAEIEPFISLLSQFGLPDDGSADYTDADGDGMNNFAEWKAGTNPTNAQSLLKLATPAFTSAPTGVVVTWQSVTNVPYYLQRASTLGSGFSTIQSNIVGRAGSTSYTDTSATDGGPYFYRVGVQ